MKSPKIGVQKPREMGANIRSVEGNNRQFEISFSSEEPVIRWFGQEILSHDEGAVDLQRINEVGVILFNHGRDTIGKLPIGKPIRTWVDSNRGKAIIEFDDDDESDKIRKKVESGTLKGVSVGYEVDVWEEIVAGKVSTNGRFAGPAYVATRWRPLEISIVSVPADSTVGVGREYEELEDERMTTQAPEAEKSGEIIRTDQQTPPQPPIATPEAEREQAAALERQRSTEIASLCRQFDMDPTKFIEENISVDQVRSQIITKISAERAPITSTVEVTKDAGDKFREAGSDAIMLRSGFRLDKPADGAIEMRGMSLRDLAIEALITEGKQNVIRMDNDTLFREALTGTGAFSALLDSTVNKSMKKGYQVANTTFELFTSKGTLKDFRPSKRYQISEAGDLQMIKENGEIKQDQVSDFGVSASLATFAKGWSITRQALINDDIDMLTKIPLAYVRASKRGINKLVYSMLGSNPSIYDGKSLFGSEHANLAAIAGGIGVASIGAGRQAMRTQKNLRGKEVLNIAPSYLIVPAGLETTAETFLHSIADPSNNNSNVKNVFNGKLNLVVDAELDAFSSDAWYLASNPLDCDTIEVSYLNGKENPTLESRVSFDVLGMNFRIFMDYGVNILDYRGLYKNTGK